MNESINFASSPNKKKKNKKGGSRKEDSERERSLRKKSSHIRSYPGSGELLILKSTDLCECTKEKPASRSTAVMTEKSRERVRERERGGGVGEAPWALYCLLLSTYKKPVPA